MIVVLCLVYVSLMYKFTALFFIFLNLQAQEYEVDFATKYVKCILKAVWVTVGFDHILIYS